MKDILSSPHRINCRRVLALIGLIYLSQFYAEAQFDSLTWMNRYSNHSVTSRDNVQKALFINKQDLYISSTTERDYTNFDLSLIRLDKELEVIWRESYTSTGNRFSYERIKDMAADSSGNIFVIGASEIDYPNPFLIKHDSEGKLLWIYDFKKSFNPHLELGPCDIETDRSGNCYLIAWINSKGPGIFWNTMIFKFDPYGNIEWYKGTDMPYPQKIAVDRDQNILTINRNDDQFRHRLVVQKYDKDGDLLFDRRYNEMRLNVIDSKSDSQKNLFIFSNRQFYNSQSFLSTNVYISKYDSLGNLTGELIFDSSDLKKVAKFVQSVNDSTYLIGIDSYSTSNGIDNQLILVNSNLHVIDTFNYDSEWHNNDYLISFDYTNNEEIIVAGLTFLNSGEFYPFIYKLRDFKDIVWMSIPAIADSTMAYPKNVFADSQGSVILIGDAEMSVTPKFGTTHSNIFISRFTSSGEELNTREFGDEGKSDISASKVKTDSSKNIYVSGVVQNGPIYLFPAYNYDQDIFLCKYSPDGIIEWNKVFDLPTGLVGFVDHLITGDSLITIVGSNQGMTKLYNTDLNGTVKDSMVYEGQTKEILQDDQGNLFLFIWNYPELHILKIKGDLSVEKSLRLPHSSLTFTEAFIKNSSIYFYTGLQGNQYLFKYGTDLEKTWEISLKAYFEGVRSLKINDLEDLLVLGTGKLLKLKSDGTPVWTRQLNYGNLMINLLRSGDIVITGTTCGTSYCAPNYLLLLSGNGEVTRSTTVPLSVRHLIVDKNDLIYLFDLNTNFRKYSPDLYLMTDDSFSERSNGYNFFFNDVTIENDNEIIIAGALGATWYEYNGLYSWKTLAVAKIGKVNSIPYISDENIEVHMHPGTTLAVPINAMDYDNDPVTYNLITPTDWVEMDTNTGIMQITAHSSASPGVTEIFYSVSDSKGGTDTAMVSVTIGNREPCFTSQPITTVNADSTYSYLLSADDPDNDEVNYEISTGPAWLNISGSGLLSGTPSRDDAGTYEIIIRCYDNYDGYGTQKFNLTVYLDTVTVKVDEIFMEGEVLIYPVPATSYLNVEINKISPQNVKIKIVDAKGTLVRMFQNVYLHNETTVQLGIGEIPTGLYYILIYDKKVLYRGKIVIQN